jgi:hypothetical protein
MPQNRQDRPTPKQVKRVLQEALLRNYPNPERKGCRGPEILREMAAREFPDEHPFWNEHVSECSPCYREFLDFRREIAGREVRQRRNTRLAIAAVIVLIIGAGSIYLSRRAPDQTSGSQSPVLSAVLNLESESISRSPSGSPSIAGEVQRIPRGRLALSIYLPTGSEAGQYDVQVLTTVSDQTPLATSSGAATIENGLTILRIAPDLSALDAGTYILSIRRGTGPWRYYRFVLS